MSEIQHPDVNGFIAATRAAGISTVVLAWRAEWGPAEPGEGIDYGRQRLVRLLGYHAGTLHVCQLADCDPDPVAAELRGAGLQVERRQRSLVDFNQGW